MQRFQKSILAFEAKRYFGNEDVLKACALPVIAILIPPTKPRPDPCLARGVLAEGAALPPAASSDFVNGAGRLCCAPVLV